MLSTQPLGVAPDDNRLGGNSLWFEVIVFWELKINGKIKKLKYKNILLFLYSHAWMKKIKQEAQNIKV